MLDPAGNAWLAAGTTSADFPVSADAADPTFNGAGDAVIAQLNAAGSALPFATFLGGSQAEGATDIGRDGAGNLYVTGNTFSHGLPRHRRRVRHRLERRPDHLLGRRLRREAVPDRRHRHRLPRRRSRPRPRWWHRPTGRTRRSRSASTGATWPARRRTRSRSTTRAPSRAPLVRTQSVTSSSVHRGWPAVHEPVLAGARRQHRRARPARSPRRGACGPSPHPPPPR